MSKIKGPAVFLAQFMRDHAPYDNWKSIAKWFAGLGYKGLQIPGWDARAIDIDKAATSKSYCDDYKGSLAEMGLQVTEIGGFLAGQVLATHPAYEVGFEAFHPKGLRGAARTKWATGELKKCILASANFGTRNIPVMSGGFCWHMVYPWPQRPPGLVEESFKELAKRWLPLLDLAKDKGCVFGYELHPGSDVSDGATFEMFLKHTKNHPAVGINYDPSHFLLQQLDYCEFIQLYGDRISGFHVKDAEFRPSGRVGVYGGYQPWAKRAGRFRSLGDGQVDFTRVFTLLTEAGFDGWAVVEWECCVKSPEQGAAEGAPFVAKHLIETTKVAFDDFAGGGTNVKKNRQMLGLS
jgi:sugar phosphate isomerase/epimerase